MSHAAGSELSDAGLKVARSLKLSTAERQRVDHPRLVGDFLVRIYPPTFQVA